MSEESTGQSPEFKSVNRVLAILSVLAAGWTVFGTSVNVSRFGGSLQRFSQSKIPIPGLPLLLVEHQAAFMIIVLVIAATCGWVTCRRPDRKTTAYLNIAGIAITLSWWVLHTTVFYATVAGVIEMSIPRNP